MTVKSALEPAALRMRLLHSAVPAVQFDGGESAAGWGGADQDLRSRLAGGRGAAQLDWQSSLSVFEMAGGKAMTAIAELVAESTQIKLAK